MPLNLRQGDKYSNRTDFLEKKNSSAQLKNLLNRAVNHFRNQKGNKVKYRTPRHLAELGLFRYYHDN